MNLILKSLNIKEKGGRSCIFLFSGHLNTRYIKKEKKKKYIHKEIF